MTELTTPDRQPTRRRHRRPGVVLASLVAVVALVASACSGGKNASSADDTDFGAAGCDPGGCILVNMVVSSEKITLLTQLAKDFNATSPSVDGKRIVVAPAVKASGDAESALAEGWDTSTDGPNPVIWSPAATSWGTILDQKLTSSGKPAMAGQGVPLMNTPLTIAMPKPMAQALGWPSKAIGWSDILALTKDPNGWATYGHPEWGPFRLGKTNPNFSTSGLHAFIAQNYSATKKTSGLTNEDLDRADVVAFNQSIESSVVHYGDTTLTFLDNWYRADQRGNPFTYASAVAVEEKSVIDYNNGNPDGTQQPGQVNRKPRVPLVSIYPKEGTLFSDSPFYTLGASWVSPEQKDAAKSFIDFVQKPENQQKVLAGGFRPANPQVALGAPIIADNGVDPNEPKTTMQVPAGDVLVNLLDKWNQQRKGARVLVVVDVSGSMGDEAASGKSKLDLAKEAASGSLSQFKPDDLVGLREFSTGLGPGANQDYLDLVPVGPLSANEEKIQSQITGLYPTNGTPLYDVTQQSVQSMLDSYDPSRINAVVLLTDGNNDDGDTSDDNRQLASLLSFLQEETQGEHAKPVRLFTIGYGKDADSVHLKQMSEAANGNYYDATDPSSITKVFTQVISNF
jgi:Ca-activated chloride channel family protein